MRDNDIKFIVTRLKYLVYIVYYRADLVWYTPSFARNIWYTPFLAASIKFGIHRIWHKILGIHRFWQPRSNWVYTVFVTKYWAYTTFGPLDQVGYTPYLAQNIGYMMLLAIWMEFGIHRIWHIIFGIPCFCHSWERWVCTIFGTQQLSVRIIQS